MEEIKLTNATSIFCWNIANPSLKRSQEQAEWLKARPENVFVLTETKNSQGCNYLEKFFLSQGYDVLFPKPEGKEYGCMLISKKGVIDKSTSCSYINFLPSRMVSVNISFLNKPLEILGIYVPSRDKSPEKIIRKRKFIDSIVEVLKLIPKEKPKIICGDFNIIETDHVPHYPFFEKWEYSFFDSLLENGFRDAFKHLNPNLQEYSWIGHTGDGYRYDYCFVSENILGNIKSSFYLHHTREMKLSDHSAIITEIAL